MAKQAGTGQIRVPINLPRLGVNRNFARGAQPDGTTWDALNVLPFDRQGRRRPAQRGGAGRVDLLAEAAPVYLLHIATLAASAAGGGSTLLSEPFTYADGDLGAETTWDTFDENDVSKTDAIAISSNKAVNGAGDYVRAYALGTTAVTFPTEYDITLTFTMGASAPGQFYQFAIFSNFDSAISDLTLIRAVFSIDRTGASGGGITLATENQADFQSDPALTLSTTHTATLRVRAGGVVSALIDGVVIATVTEASPFIFGGANSYGFALDGNDPTLDAVTIDDFQITTPGGGGTLSKTALKLIATSGDTVYIGDSPPTMGAISNAASFPIDDTSFFVSAATLFSKTYLVDGSDIFQIDLATEQFETYTVSAGTPPTNPTIAVAWRGRLVLSGDRNEPQNIWASEVNDPTDWNISVTPPTETMAWVANTGNLGRVGPPVHALIPVSDDILVVGCEQSMFVIRGDLASNGSIDNLTENTGIVGQNAWCRAADGSIYFVGGNGFYKMAPDGSEPVEISRDIYPQFFQGFDRSQMFVTCVYDPSRYGIWIFLAPLDEDDAPAVSLFYDAILGGFWPIEFTNEPLIGPLSAVFWDGFESTLRYPTLGGYDGRLSALTFANRHDSDGVTNVEIESYLFVGPLSISSVDDAIFTRLDITGGEVKTGDDAGVWNVNWTVYGGPTAYDVTEGFASAPYSSAGNIAAAGRFNTEYPRVRGGWFSLKFDNGVTGNYWSLEDVVGFFLPGGVQRA